MNERPWRHRAGETVGSYELLSPLGRGAGGEVWKARHREWRDRFSAVKFPGSDRAARTEGNILRGLDHPAIVRVEDLDTLDGEPWIRLELVEGETLRERLDRDEPFSPDETERVMQVLLDALAHADQQGVVHGDLKPSNILMAEEGTVKVTDFGMPFPVPEVEVSTSVNEAERRQLVGTVGYLAPEVIRGATPDVRSDLYSLGVVLHEMLTGKLPQGRTPTGEVRKGLDPRWDALLERLLCDREKRFASFAQAREFWTGTSAPRSSSNPRWLLPFGLAFPLFVIAAFLTGFLPFHFRVVQPMLLGGLFLLGLTVMGVAGRSFCAPWASALFWCGLGVCLGGRWIFPVVPLVGGGMMAGGMVLYGLNLLRSRRRAS